MRFSKIAVAASAAGSAMAAESICNKYTAALLKTNTGANQYTLLTLLVNTVVIGNFTGPGTKNSDLPGSMNAVPGILAPGTVSGTKVNLLPYFDGSLVSTNQGGKAVSQNFLDGGGATPLIADPTSSGTKGSNQYFLLTHLYQFFGVLLGCSEYGMSGFPSYGGDPSMGSVHQYMDLSEAEFTYFVEQVGMAATSFGVTTADATAVGKALVAGFGYKCAPPAEIVPGDGKLTQAICVGSMCPEASSPMCSAYVSTSPPMKAGAVVASTTAVTSTAVVPPPTSTVPFGGAARQTGAAVMAAAGVLAAALL